MSIEWGGGPSTPEWREAVLAWGWQRRGDYWTVEGDCPRCGDVMSDEVRARTTVVLGMARTSDHMRPDPVPPVTEVVLECNCTGDHAGRPEQVTAGCGFSVVIGVRFP